MKRVYYRNEFRKYKVSGHPAYIYEKVGNDYKYIGLTHSKISDKTKNIRLDKNPDPKDMRTAYFKPYSEMDKTNKFKQKYRGWKFVESDKKKIQKYKNKKRTK